MLSTCADASSRMALRMCLEDALPGASASVSQVVEHLDLDSGAVRPLSMTGTLLDPSACLLSEEGLFFLSSPLVLQLEMTSFIPHSCDVAPFLCVDRFCCCCSCSGSGSRKW